MKIIATYFNRVVLLLLLIINGTLLLGQANNSDNNSKLTGNDSIQVMFRAPFYDLSLKTTSAPVTLIKGVDLESFPSIDIRSALTGKIANSVVSELYNPLQEKASIRIRGGNYLVLIDGIPRSISEISAYEIESINVIKGFSATAMYGSDASEGILFIETKKGSVNKKSVNITIDQGIKHIQKSFLPTWLNSYDYATLYNEASRNDGITEVYSSEALDAYKNGTSPIRYPNEDLYQQLFNENMNYSRVNMNYQGGNDISRYFINLAYESEGNGLYKIGDFNTNGLSLRTNLDVTLSSFMELKVGAFGSLKIADYPNAEGEIWDVLSSYPPNAYPVKIYPDTFGVTPSFPINPVGDLTNLLNSKDFDRKGRFNVELLIDLSSVLKGLKLNSLIAYDIQTFSTISERINKTYPLFEPIFIDEDDIPDDLIQYGLYDPSAGIELTNDFYTGQLYNYTQLAYKRRFNKHAINAGIVNTFKAYSYRLTSSTMQDVKKQDLSFNLNYSYNNKYNLDYILSYNGIMNLTAEKRFKAFPTIGVSWVISEEPIFASSSWLNFLKIRGSYGQIGIFNSDELFLYSTYWDQTGRTTFNNRFENSVQTFPGTVRMQIGNEDIGWGKMTEQTVGADISVFKNKFSASIDFFKRKSDGLVLTSPIPSIIGSQNYFSNLGSVERKGYDFSLNFNLVSTKDFDFDLNVNAGFNESILLASNELEQPYPWMERIGNPTDAIYGLVADGLIGNETESSEPVSLFGNTNAGNIKYVDLNDDGFIQGEVDEKMIGNSQPRYNYGLNLRIRYKQLSLNVTGFGLADYDINTLYNPYYYAYGSNKYSSYVMDNRWTEDTPNSDAGHPRLTTKQNNNDNRLSSYWLIEGGFFKIKNAELAYMINPKFMGENNHIKLFVRGTNLLTFSKIKALDPENISLGVTTYPSMQTFSMGLSVSFNK